MLLYESIQLRLRHKHTHCTSILIFLFFSGDDSELDGVELAEHLVDLHYVGGARVRVHNKVIQLILCFFCRIWQLSFFFLFFRSVSSVSSYFLGLLKLFVFHVNAEIKVIVNKSFAVNLYFAQRIPG